MPRRRDDLGDELASLVDKLTQEIVRAFGATPIEALVKQRGRRRRGPKEPTDLMQRLAARMRESGVARVDAVMRERPTRRRRSTS